MNRSRQETRTPRLVFFSLFLAAAIAAVGVVLHGSYKNRQVQINRELKVIDRRVAQYRDDINITEMRVEELLNCFAIRKQIQANGSSLRPIPIGVVEEIDASSLSRQSVASIVP